MRWSVGLALLLASAADAFHSPTLALGMRARRPRQAGSCPPVSMKLAAIFFGCDGVLVDSERDGHRVALNQAIAEVKPGLECSVDAYGKLLMVRGEERLMGVWKEMGWDGMSMPMAEQIYKRKSEIFTEMLEQKAIPLRPGVGELIDAAIAAGIQVAVCSSNTQKNVELIVNSMGMVRASNIHIFAGGRVVNRKPHPDIFNLAKGTLGVDAADCLVIEDDQAGLDAAKAANIACLIARSTYTKDQDFKLADRVEESLADVDLEALVTLPSSMVGLNA
ncbi:MAG: HAD-IA family hydrolase [Promethearchaeia archaeon]